MPSLKKEMSEDPKLIETFDIEMKEPQEEIDFTKTPVLAMLERSMTLQVKP